VATALSLDNLQFQLALAQRQVVKDVAQVDADATRLALSQRQFAQDQRAANGVSDRQRIAQQQQLVASVTSTGEPLGRLINVAA
jgi:hypothetical protein